MDRSNFSQTLSEAEPALKKEPQHGKRWMQWIAVLLVAVTFGTTWHFATTAQAQISPDVARAVYRQEYMLTRGLVAQVSDRERVTYRDVWVSVEVEEPEKLSVVDLRAVRVRLFERLR
ncbi:MAG: hypothetical protein HQL50_03750 [Magnetococcales bacterium]|nr:hypothetical protein [Magnetococcales bacterium]